MNDARQSRAWKRLRAHWAALVVAGAVPCARCGHLIEPGQPWDLGHPEGLSHAEHGTDETTLRLCRPEHAYCNRAAHKAGSGTKARIVSPPSDGGLW